METAVLLCAADALRLSSCIQEAFRQAEASGGLVEWMDLVEPLVERPVLEAYGLRVGDHLARLRYEPNVRPELRPRAHWLRHNRARAVPFAVGDPAPEATVIPVGGSMGEAPLASLLRGPTLVVASSRT